MCKLHRNLLLVFTFLSVSGLAPAVQSEETSQRSEYRFDAGLGLRFMPVGWFDLANGSGQTSFRAFPALGFSPFVDYRVSKYISVGVSPEVTFNVIPNRTDYLVGKMLALNARLQLRYPNRTRFEPYLLATGGYSHIWRNGGDSASGPDVGSALGVRAAFAARHAVFAEVGYQKGFQKMDGGAYGPSYVITAAGWQVGF